MVRNRDHWILYDLRRKLPEWDWKYQESGEKGFVLDKFEPCIFGSIDLEGFDVPYLTTGLSSARMEYRHFAQGVRLFSLEFYANELIPQITLVDFLKKYQSHIAAIIRGAKGVEYLTQSIGKHTSDVSNILFQVQKSLENRVSQRGLGFENSGFGSTYCDSIFVLAESEDEREQFFKYSGLKDGVIESAELDEDILFFANYDFTMMCFKSESDLLRYKNILDYMIYSSVLATDIARIARDKLAEIDEFSDLVPTSTEHAINSIRKTAYLLRIDSLPYSITNWEGEQKFFSYLAGIWNYYQAIDLAVETIDAATHELGEAINRRRRASQQMLGKLVSILSLCTVLGLFAQLVDFAYSDLAPDIYLRRILLALTTTFLGLMILFIMRRLR